MKVVVQINCQEEQIVQIADGTTVNRFIDIVVEQLFAGAKEQRLYQIKLLIRGKEIPFSDEVLISDFSLDNQCIFANLFVKALAHEYQMVSINGQLFMFMTL